MAKDKSEDKGGKRRVEVRKLPAREKELSGEERKQVKGGETLAVIPSLKDSRDPRA